MRFLAKIYFTICAISIVIFLIVLLYDEDVRHAKEIEPVIKYILLYETPPWMDHLKLDPPNSRCIVTTDRKYLPKIEMFDALLFSGSHWWMVEWSFPSVRPMHQLYVYVNMESPLTTFHTFATDPRKEIYNITMSYRRDSDIYWPYGFISKQNITYLSSVNEENWMIPEFEEVEYELLQKIWIKNKTAAWFVSNCKDKSNRMQLVQAMQKTIDVDIYGKCGTLECSMNTKEECYELIEQDYYFYFSFENALCSDYITEKVFNIMRYDVVPVVYGGANYTQHLPPHSYIDANDFATATDLANYLTSLRRDTREYAKYFWWKKHYRTVVSSMMYNNLCDKIHDLSSVISEGKSIGRKPYENIQNWWMKNQCSDPHNIRFE
uniref:Fucosyltransferase n=2 Tax=Nyssomyia neivai TaxID=330878 RepID=A0A1L8E1H9_9DIPT